VVQKRGRKKRNDGSSYFTCKNKGSVPQSESRELAWGVVSVAAFLLDVVTVQPCGGCSLHQPHFLREAIGCHNLRAVAAANEMKDQAPLLLVEVRQCRETWRRGGSDQMSVRMLGKAVFGMVIAPFSGLTPRGLAD
jgi:hypothetical protein